jgi:hypothetical protein
MIQEINNPVQDNPKPIDFILVDEHPRVVWEEEERETPSSHPGGSPRQSGHE